MYKFKFTLFSLVLILCSCQNKIKDKHTDTFGAGEIPIAVDESFRPIVQGEIDVFEALNSKASIVPNYTSEVNAINLLLKDSVRVAIATRELSLKEISYLNSKKFYPHSYKIATDGVALIINKSNPDSLITVGQIKRILSGEISEWKDIYPTSKLGKFKIVFDNSNSSTMRYAIDSISNGQPLRAKELFAQNTNPEVIDYVSKTPNAIGIIGVNWIGNHMKDSTNLSFKDEVRVMAVSGEIKASVANSYKPFQAYFFYGYYPLTRIIYVIINDPRTSLPTGFCSFLTSTRGQLIISKAGLLPATQTVRIVHVKDE
jgi:phosphate transport system substrate-binding protein